MKYAPKTTNVIIQGHEVWLKGHKEKCKEQLQTRSRQLQYYREYRKRHYSDDSKKIFGAIAAAVFPNAVQQVALDSGYYVIVPRGESIKIVVPKKVELKAF